MNTLLIILNILCAVLSFGLAIINGVSGNPFFVLNIAAMLFNVYAAYILS